MLIYLLRADGFNQIEHHPATMTSDFAFLSRGAAEAYIPEWRKELLAVDSEGEASFYENPRDITTELEIGVIEVELRGDVTHESNPITALRPFLTDGIYDEGRIEEAEKFCDEPVPPTDA